MKNSYAWKPLSNFFYIHLILFSFSSILSTEILIDGELSEKEWQTAREINKFYEVFPFSLNRGEIPIKLIWSVNKITSPGFALGLRLPAELVKIIVEHPKLFKA